MKAKTVVIIGAVSAGLLLAYYTRNKAQAVVNSVNPFNPDNVIHGGATNLAAEITGNEHALQDGADYVFSALDLLNPWAPEYRKKYAKQVIFGEAK